MDRRPIDLPLDQPPWSLAVPVIEGLRAGGFQAVFVGGCVRDLLVGRPVKDIDLATDARPEEVEALFERCVTVGRQFGVTVVLVPGGEVEVASFRSDGAYVDGRRPTNVRPASEAEDVERRDFTLNALVADPSAGELRDHVGGLADLDARRLRVVGDPGQRLAEDRLRVLRGLRFASQLELSIDPATASALRATPLSGLSRERVWDEWDKGLDHPRRAAWARSVEATGHLAELCPALAGVRGIEELLARLERLPADAALDAAVALMLQSSDPGAVLAWLADEPISRERRRRLDWALLRGRPGGFDDLDLADRRAELLRPEAALLADLATAWDWPQGRDLAEEGETLRAEPPEPLLTGADLLALGHRPGPALGTLLHDLRRAQLAGELTDRPAAEAFARARLPG